ncbi:hypothetical protein [Methylophilus sp. 3sh_L]|uniref:hypothetical protein n=1 Tax=Methylophilus sp. 3sh_L TaxID=3377114 RepID=UPI00398F2BCB
MTTLKRISIEVIVLLCLSAVVWLFASSHATPPAPVQTIEATPAPVLINTPLIDMALSGPVKVYSGGAKTKQKLKLPASVVKDDSKQVIAGTRIEANDDHPKTVTTVIDADTGESTTYVTTEPLPWLAVDTRGGIGLYTGFKNGQQVARLQVQQDVLQIKQLHVGAIASVDQPLSGAGQQDYFIGVGAEYRW